MGAKIGKLINDDSDVKELDDWDPELGEDDDTSATWDSSSSSGRLLAGVLRQKVKLSIFRWRNC